MTIDLNRAAMLLDVMQKVANVGPMFTALGGRAGDELKAMNDEVLEDNKKKAKAENAKALAEADRVAAEINPRPNRIFPEGSGVKEDHDPPIVQRKV